MQYCLCYSYCSQGLSVCTALRNERREQIQERQHQQQQRRREQVRAPASQKP